MIIVNGGRGCGKTTKLIELAAEKDYYIICADRKRVNYLLDLARDYDLNIRTPITFDEFVGKRYYGLSIKGFLLDDLSDYLRYIEPRVQGFSYSITEDDTTYKGRF